MLCNWKFLEVSVLRATKPGVISRIGRIGAIAFLLMTPPIASGQIVPDSTLPTNSTITPNGNTLVIEGGTYSGENLFHSFSEFSLPTGTSAYFNNLLSIENILSRVTGGSISNIDGILRANGGANLFLLNPNGIVFGPNAALNIGGSFFASTADSLRLSDGSDFSATSANAPPLLTINVPLGLQLGPSPGKIINQSTALDSNSNNGNIVGLAVEPGETIGLVGGDISIEGGSLSAPVGTIKLISLSNGFWELGQEQNSSLETGAIGNSQFGDIQLTRESNVSTSGVGGGSINVLAGRLSVTDGSQLVAITEGEQAGGVLKINTTSSVEVIGNSADGLEPSRISSQSQGAGSAGDLSIETTNLTVKDGIISAATFASGAGGNLTVRATSSVELVGGTVDGILRGLVNASLGTGDAGDLTVETGRLTVRDGGFIFSGNRSEGNGGNLAVRATERVEVTGTSTDGTLPSTIQSAATSGSESVQLRFGLSFPSGNAGNLTIETGSLIVSDGAEISTKTDGSGNSGNLSVFASELVEVRGTSRDGQLASNLATDITGAGAGGDLTIETGRLLMAEEGFLSASAFGAGDGGNITIRGREEVKLVGTGFERLERDFIAGFVNKTLTTANRNTGFFASSSGAGASGEVTIETPDLMLQDGSIVSALIFGSGTGGQVSIRAEKVEVLGSIVAASTLSEGAGGDIEIDASELILANGGLLGNSTVGAGSSGNILVRASEKVEMDSTPPGALVGTGIFADSFGGTGAGGNIRIETRQLVVKDGARVSASSGLFAGNDIIRTGGVAANIEAQATEEVEIAGMSPDGRFRSALTSTTLSSAPGGKVTVDTGRLIVRDGAEISTSAFGDGAGGDITVNANQEVKLRGNGFRDLEINNLVKFVSGELTLADRVTGIFAGTEGNGASGNILIDTPQLTIEEGAIISAPTFSSGAGGRISINANRVEAIASALGATTAGTGSAGNIEIDTAELIIRDGTVVASATSDAGNGGNIVIRASESVKLSSSPPSSLVGNGIYADSIGTGAGGSIQIDTARLNIAEGAGLSTRAGILLRDGRILLGGKGGDIEVRASEAVELSGVSGDFRSQISAATFSAADAGEVSISTGSLTLGDGAEISTSAFGDGAGGDITVTASQEVKLRGNGFRNFEGNILANFVSGELTLADRVTGMFAGTEGNGASGNILIDTPQLTIEEGGIIFAPTFSSGAGGRISINANRVEAIASGLGAITSGTGSAGTIEIDTAELIIRDGAVLSSSTSDAGTGGNIVVRASESVKLSSSLPSALVGSGIYADSIGTGAGGNIQIDTARLNIAEGAGLSTRAGVLLRDAILLGGQGGNVEVRASESVELSGTSGNFRSQISASTASPADAGEVRISTRNLTVRDGAEISVATLSSGKGGTLTIEASGTTLLTGRSGDGRFTSRFLAASGDPNVELEPTGAAGDLRIIGGELLVTDGATVAVNSLGTGDAGSLTAIAREIRLDDRGTLTASPNAALGGNINLTAGHLQLRRGSAIATDAGNSDGGNITINADTLAALENSDISANAQGGFGGRVSVNAEGIFGTSFRERQTPNSDITATSQLGPQFSGTVEINTPEVDPGAGLVKLPETVVDITGLVARDPCHNKDESEFIITGRGGLPPSPFDPLSNPVIAIEWAAREDAASAGVSRSSNTRATNTSPRNRSTAVSRNEQFTKSGSSPENQPIVEATGWRVDINGDIILTADSPNVAPYRPGLTAPSCGEGP